MLSVFQQTGYPTDGAEVERLEQLIVSMLLESCGALTRWDGKRGRQVPLNSLHAELHVCVRVWPCSISLKLLARPWRACHLFLFSQTRPNPHLPSSTPRHIFRP